MSFTNTYSIEFLVYIKTQFFNFLFYLSILQYSDLLFIKLFEQVVVHYNERVQKVFNFRQCKFLKFRKVQKKRELQIMISLLSKCVKDYEYIIYCQ